MLKRKRIMLIINLLLIFISFICVSLADAQQNTNEQEVASVENQEHYKIGANDLLNIFVWKEPELTQDVIVMPDGRITFPMIGEIMAKGRSAIEIKNIMTEKLQDYISGPEVTVLVRQSNSRRIYIIGKVNGSGPYILEADMTVLQALSVAGGFTEWADTKYVMIVRRTEGKETMFRFNYQKFITGKDLNQNILLEPGDTIVVR